MAGDGPTSREELEALRVSFIRSELKRIRLASFAMTTMGLLCLLFLALVARAGYPRVEWQLIAMLGFAAFCLAFPLFRKFDVSREGSGFETRDPLELIEKMQARTNEAGSESFEQLRTQIGGLSDHLNEICAQLARMAPPAAPAGPPAAGAPVGPLSAASVSPADLPEQPEDELSLRRIRERLPAVTHADDPQKGRFGGDEAANGRILKARVEPAAMGNKWQKVTLTVAATNGVRLEGRYVYLFLHDTYKPDAHKVKPETDGLTASLELLAWGAFTVGAVADCGKTSLELDLAISPNVSAPADWQAR